MFVKLFKLIKTISFLSLFLLLQGSLWAEEYLADLTTAGNLNGVKAYLKKGGDINQIKHNNNGYCFNGLMDAKSLPIAKLLVENGIDIDQRMPDNCSNSGSTALYNLIFLGKTEIVNYLISKKANLNFGYLDCSPLWVAAYTGKVEIARILIKSGANVNARCNENNNKSFPLIEAVFNGNFEMVKLLVESNADINLKDPRGFSSYEVAKDREDRIPRIFAYLKSKGAK